MAEPWREVVGAFLDAAVEDQTAALALLRQHPELREARWLHQETLVHFLAVEGYTEAVRLLGLSGFDVNAPNKFGDSPLIDVATLGDDRTAEVLLALGADPNATSVTQDNALHCAVRSGNARLVDLLLTAGARMDYVTDLDETVLDALPEDPAQRAAVDAILDKHGGIR